MLKKLESILCNLERFKGRHEGESCYIFGDGPSLKWLDLACFGDFPAICCGMLPFHRQFKQIDVRYCLLVEPRLFLPKFMQPKSLSECSAVVDAYRTVIETNPDRRFFLHVSNYLSFSAPNVSYLFRGLPAERDGADHVLNRHRPFSGSFHASLALASHFGFSKIYLVGFDAWTLQPARDLHWYELGEGILFEPTNLATDFLNDVSARADIFTISPFGQSQNVTHIDYRNYTGKLPEFRENFELIERHHLEALATYPAYNIFSTSPTLPHG